MGPRTLFLIMPLHQGFDFIFALHRLSIFEPPKGLGALFQRARSLRGGLRLAFIGGVLAS